MYDLNHPKVARFTKEIAAQHQLDSTFIDFIFSESRPEPFHYWCEDADRGWTCFVPNHVTVAYPLWCTNGDQTLLLVSDAGLSFGEGYHDNPDIEMISSTSQGLLARLLMDIWNSESSTEEMILASQFCGFLYLDDLFKEFNTPLPKGADYSERSRQFISGIDDRHTP